MPALKVLIVGGGIAGPACAYWLARAGHDVTVLERAPTLRAQGQQIDVRGQAVTTLRRMGVLDQVRAKVVHETGLRIVDRHDRTQAVIKPNKTGKGRQSFTSEFEIMRGDLCRILYEAAQAQGATFVFGQSIVKVEQDGDEVVTGFADETSARYDLVIGADGQSSKMRRMLWEDEPGFHPWDLYFAYYNIPRQPSDTRDCVVCKLPSRFLMMRGDDPDTVQAYLGIVPSDPELKSLLEEALATHDLMAQKKALAACFRHAGWQADRMVDGFDYTGDGKDNFYFHKIGQVKTKTWHKGRVVLLGDAGYCPSPLSGLGTSTALVGAYVLAGVVATACTAADVAERKVSMSTLDADTVEAMLDKYDEVLRPYVDKVQKLPPGAPGILYPAAEFWIWVQNIMAWLYTLLGVDTLLARFGSDDVKGWELPEYPALKWQGDMTMDGQDVEGAP